MLVSSIQEIGAKLLLARRKAGLTQVEVAEQAGLSDRTYADIERGMANMRVETLLRICRVLEITPNDILTRDEAESHADLEKLWAELTDCTPKEKDTAAKLLLTYLNSKHFQ